LTFCVVLALWFWMSLAFAPVVKYWPAVWANHRPFVVSYGWRMVSFLVLAGYLADRKRTRFGRKLKELDRELRRGELGVMLEERSYRRGTYVG
jgi:hypothetical protein